MQTGYYSTQVISKLQAIVDNGITVSNTDLSTVATNTTDISSDTSYMEDHLTYIKTNTQNLNENTGNTATNTENILLQTTKVADCVWVAQNQLKVDLKTINDTAVETNAGNLSAGCPRVCIASDDVNLSEVYQCVDHANHQLQCNINALGGNMTATNQGYLSNGTSRVCIATDDINIAPMSNNLANLGLAVDVGNSRLKVDQQTMAGYTVETNQGYLSNGTQRVCIANDDINLAGVNTTLSTISTTLTNIYTILNDIWDNGNNYIRTHETP